MLIAKGLGDTRYFVSPDLSGGTIDREAGGHLDRPLGFARAFDKLMSYGFRLECDHPPGSAVPAMSPTLKDLRQASIPCR